AARLLEQARRHGTTALCVAPGNPAALTSCIRRATRRDIPVICVVTDAPETQRLTAVSDDPFTGRAVAGELLSRFRPGGGRLAFFTGWLGTQDHAEKLRGFEASLKDSRSAAQLGPVVEAHDDPREGYRRALKLLRANRDLKGMFISTVNSLPVLQAAEQEGRLQNLT